MALPTYLPGRRRHISVFVVCLANVIGTALLDGPPEKGFAALTARHAVMHAAGNVLTHQTGPLPANLQALQAVLLFLLILAYLENYVC